MLKLGLCILACLNLSAQDDNMLGKGLWSLIAIESCPDDQLSKESIVVDVNKHKLNRTHDGITAHVIINDEITEEYGLFLDVCKHVDGGCKQYQIVSDNMGKLCDKYARDNVMRALQMGNFNTDYFPLEVGEYDLEDFMIDYCSLPPDCPFGKYEAITYLLSGVQKVFCIKVIIECKNCEDDDVTCCDNGGDEE